MKQNEHWAQKIIKRWDNSFKHRWTVFSETVRDLQGASQSCLDIGCGENSELTENLLFKMKNGTDLIMPNNLPKLFLPFLQSDLYHLPFKDNCYDVVLMRFVVEHIEFPVLAFKEINRILKPGGLVLILTTNIYSPIIFIPKLLPYQSRKKLMLKLFGVEDDDIFPTFHRLNTKNSIRKIFRGYQTEKFEYIQDLNWSRKWVFIIFFSWHLLTKLLKFHFLRTNFITLLKSSKSN